MIVNMSVDEWDAVMRVHPRTVGQYVHPAGRCLRALSASIFTAVDQGPLDAVADPIRDVPVLASLITESYGRGFPPALFWRIMLDPHSFRLDGKTVLVTGAARGLGRAMAIGFAVFGADVALCDKLGDELADTKETIEVFGRKADTAVLDVRDAAAVNDWVESLGAIDVLVNNAAGTFHGAFLDASANAQRALIDTNFTSVTNFVRACVPKMPSPSSIINITSVEAFRAAPGFGVYGAMKAAVEHLTRTLALELSDRGIRVNTIAPDGLPTPGDGDLYIGDMDDYARKLALGWGDTDDICGPAVFLASAASRYVTGTTIHVDGGSNASRGWSKDATGNWVP